MTKNKIDARLEQCKAEGRKALITFITAGDGGYDCTEKAVLEMAKNGADLIELGVPFSDPIAEGPVIQRANVPANAPCGTVPLWWVFSIWYAVCGKKPMCRCC